MRTIVRNAVWLEFPLVIWDVAVVGAGPAGLAAAHAASAAGARTIVLERATHPRYKTCGGGLIGTSLQIAEARLAAVPGPRWSPHLHPAGPWWPAAHHGRSRRLRPCLV
jgi:2-polyprenyl-6-methoxyphenol hydroxylase-like FAD-dependent oxidoreductase